MPCSSTTLAMAAIGSCPSTSNRTDFEMTRFVGNHETPVEILTYDETEQHAGLRLRGHEAVGEQAFFVEIGIALPYAGVEAARHIGREEKCHQPRCE